MSEYISLKAGMPYAGMASITEQDKQFLQESKRNTGTSDENARLKKACLELESIFIHHLLKEMRATIPKSELTGGESIKEMYNHMTDSQLARKLANDGGIGLSELLIRQLKQTADKGSKNPPGKID
jgi:flagellar protein FlgJ